MSEDLFYNNTAPGRPNPDPLNETLAGFCLCDGTERCGRKAVSDTTADPSEPQRNVRLGVPRLPFLRRRKRDTTSPGEDEASTGSRTYRTDYEYDSQRLVIFCLFAEQIPNIVKNLLRFLVGYFCVGVDLFISMQGRYVGYNVYFLLAY